MSEKRHEVVRASELTHDDNDNHYECVLCHEISVSLTSVARHVVANQYEVRNAH